MTQLDRRTITALLGLCAGLGLLLAVVPAGAASLQEVLHGPQRSPAFVARDSARHPAEELAFFGLAPDQTVVELFPGGGYWTEILAPYLHDQGHYYVALPAPDDPEAPTPGQDRFRAKLAADPALYGKVQLSALGRGRYDVAPAGSADLIVTFRNLHNWMAAGYAEAALAGLYRALKPGGILGIEDHRGRDDVAQDPAAADGYVRQDYAVELARRAGFELVDSSAINANPRDTRNWPKGVWTLPPTLALGEQDRAKYLAIGEADNFVLKFRKPRP